MLRSECRHCTLIAPVSVSRAMGRCQQSPFRKMSQAGPGPAPAWQPCRFAGPLRADLPRSGPLVGSGVRIGPQSVSWRTVTAAGPDLGLAAPATSPQGRDPPGPGGPPRTPPASAPPRAGTGCTL